MIRVAEIENRNANRAEAGLSISIVFDIGNDDALYEFVVRAIFSLGSRYCICVGANAMNIHDKMDEIIERLDEEYLDIVTMTMECEPASEVAEFSTNGTYPGETISKLFLFVDRTISDQIDFSAEIIANATRTV